MNFRPLGRCCVAFVALLGIGPMTLSAQTPPLFTLHIVASPVDDVTPVLYAQRAGLFQKAGLNVIVDKANSGAAAAVVGGAVDIGKGAVTAVILAHAHNVPLVIVAPAAVYDPKTPDAVLVTAAGSPIRTARDLAGKVVGVPSLGDLSAIATESWMQNNGADWKNTQFIEVPYPAMLDTLQKDRIQVATLIKPFIDPAVDSGKATVLGLMYSAVAPRFLESAWFATADFVAAHKDAIAAFQRVIAQAAVYTNAHPSETVDLLAAYTGLDPQVAAHVARIVCGTTLQAKDIQPVIDISAKFNLIPKAFSAQEIMPH
jgi:NitT/TauT family transport system substrate-binding protein